MTHQRIYVTTYCNHAHDVRDGKPIAHECHVLPVAALEAEMRGDVAQAIEILAATPSSERRVHKGKRSRK